MERQRGASLFLTPSSCCLGDVFLEGLLPFLCDKTPKWRKRKRRKGEKEGKRVERRGRKGKWRKKKGEEEEEREGGEKEKGEEDKEKDKDGGRGGESVRAALATTDLGTTTAHTLAWWVDVCCAFQVRIPALRSRESSELVLVTPDLCS